MGLKTRDAIIALLALVAASLVAASLLPAAGAKEAFSNPDKVRDSLRKRWLMYSMHALERMEQRKITEKLVARTVAAGKVNAAKSEPPDKYAVELYEQGRWIRVVLAPYLWFFATVVTVIDLRA